MTIKFTKIDELLLPDHYFLSKSDRCYCYGEYTARQGYGFSETNQLIYNLKKSVERQHYSDYRYKEEAINQVANHIAEIGNISDFTVVPIPPSKGKDDPLYDDRLVKILEAAKSINPDVDYRELVIQAGSYQASHLVSGGRQRPEELMARYRIDSALIDGIKDIVIFDDVLTAGSHFAAMKQFIARYVPNKRILGLFVARTARGSEESFEDLI